MMNSCLQKPCPFGFAYHPLVRNAQTDTYGAFRYYLNLKFLFWLLYILCLQCLLTISYSFSTTGVISGMENNATAFVGCDNGHVSRRWQELDEGQKLRAFEHCYFNSLPHKVITLIATASSSNTMLCIAHPLSSMRVNVKKTSIQTSKLWRGLARWGCAIKDCREYKSQN